jgi:hypothetical protein
LYQYSIDGIECSAQFPGYPSHASGRYPRNFRGAERPPFVWVFLANYSSVFHSDQPITEFYPKGHSVIVTQNYSG